MNPGRKDPGRVADQEVSRVQETGQVSEDMMMDFPGGPVDDKESRLIPPGGRVLGDEGIGERVIKEISLHVGGLTVWMTMLLPSAEYRP